MPRLIGGPQRFYEQFRTNRCGPPESIKINGKQDVQTKTMITMFGLFAEIERDLISERTKQGLQAARAKGKILGRPKGLGKSRLDDFKPEIEALLKNGSSKTFIAKR